MDPTVQLFLVCSLCVLVVFYVVRSGRETPRRSVTFAHRDPTPCQLEDDEEDYDVEYFEADPEVDTLVADQAAIEFSDILPPPEEKAATAKVEEDAKQVQSVNERFDAAKRKVTENRLRPGLGNYQQRRKLIEALLRRPQCTRRVRNWRQENGDILRGDAIPKSTTSSWGVMRMGRNNPSVDLHPGAMGTMSGLSGRWLSEEDTPDNAIESEW